MTLEEAIKAGHIKQIQVHNRYMIWDGMQWVVYKKFRGNITPISKSTSIEVALEDLCHPKK